MAYKPFQPLEQPNQTAPNPALHLSVSPAAEQAPPRRGRAAAHTTGLTAISAALLAMIVLGVALLGLLGMGAYNLLAPARQHTNPPAGSFSVISISGTIQNSGSSATGAKEHSYLHSDTLRHIKQLAEDGGNRGILLRMNTSGGGVYESDEVYTALMDYKEKTGRPVWAYMAQTCASGGYYICAAADRIIANRNTTTGSIGVYITMTDASELYEHIGVETVVIKSGENKGVGLEGTPITDSQRAVYQGIVDDSYERFIQLVADGREIPLDQVRKLADGRIYSGQQALANGLVDELGDWDSTLEAFQQATEGQAFYPSFSRQSALGRLVGQVAEMLPRSETQVLLDAAQALPNGVPMAYYQPGPG